MKNTTRKKVSDRDRFSIIQPTLDYCFYCNSYNVPLEKHEVFHGTANRQKSKNWGMVVALCPRCHRMAHKDAKVDKMLKMLGQKAFEDTYSREKFMEVFGRNYLC